MKAKLAMFQEAGLRFSETGGRLKVVGDPAAIKTFSAEILESKAAILDHLKLINRQALACSDIDKALLEKAVNLIDTIQKAGGAADGLIKAFNSVEAAEDSESQSDFDFALAVLRAEVDAAAG